MKMLLVAEKKSAGEDFAKVLGATEKHNGYLEGDNLIVTWAQGHIIGLKEPEDHDARFKRWKVEDLPIYFDINKNLKVMQPAIFKTIKELIHREDVCGIINAGDPGREGELIQRWIYRMAGNRKPVVRLWCDTLTPSAIQKAYQNLRDSSEFDTLFEAGEARAELDQFLGYNYSRLLTLTRAENLTISFGRCQTPLLNQIILRDYEVENFISVPYWEVKAEFCSDNEKYVGNLIDESGNTVQFSNELDAKSLLTGLRNFQNAIILSSRKERKKKRSPLLFNLNELQKTIARKYHYDADKTLSIAQSLYDTHKILSYPRTDSRYLSTELQEVMPNILQSLRFGKFETYISKIFDIYAAKAPKSYFDDNKVTDHHALLPAQNKNTAAIYERLDQEEKNVFDAIVYSLMAIFFPAYEYVSVEIVTQIFDFSFLSRGVTIAVPGWKVIYQEDSQDQEDVTDCLPHLEKGDAVNVLGMNIKNSKTKPKKRFSTDSILSLMEKYNIGTAATQSNIIKELTRAKGKNQIAYVERQGDNYISTEFARKFIEFIPDNLKSLEFVGAIDTKLEEIANGELTKQEFLNEQIEKLKRNIELFSEDISTKLTSEAIISDDALKCPLCKKALIKYSWGIGCSGYRNKDSQCKFSLPNTFFEKELTDEILKTLVTTGKTGKIKGFISSKGKEFDEKLYLVDGKLKFGFQIKDKAKLGSVSGFVRNSSSFSVSYKSTINPFKKS